MIAGLQDRLHGDENALLWHEHEGILGSGDLWRGSMKVSQSVLYSACHTEYVTVGALIRCKL